MASFQKSIMSSFLLHSSGTIDGQMNRLGPAAQQVKPVKSLWPSGASAAEIARQVGVNTSLVSRAITRMERGAGGQ